MAMLEHSEVGLAWGGMQRCTVHITRALNPECCDSSKCDTTATIRALSADMEMAIFLFGAVSELQTLCRANYYG